jgi:hypothetical protein
VDVTTCGQLVPAGETGVLQNDLACSPTLGCYECRPNMNCFPTGAACTVDADCTTPDAHCAALPAIAIDVGGTLDMNGHAVAASDGVAVLCRPKGRCTVTSTTGRGDISGSSVGILMKAGKLTASHVDVHANTGGGIYSPLLATDMALTDVTADDNGGIGIRGDSIRANDVTANGNGQHGIEANGKLRGASVVTNANDGTGIVAGKGARIDGLTSTGNGVGGSPHAGAGLIVAKGSPLLSNATVTGNTYGTNQGPVALDLITLRKPKLTASTCDHSIGFDRKTAVLGEPWGVCAGD